MAESRKQSGNNERFYVVRVYGAWLRVDIVCVSIFRRIHAFTDALTVPTGKQKALLFLTLLTERNGMRCRNHRMYCNIISHIRYHENTHIVSHCTLATMLLYIYMDLQPDEQNYSILALYCCFNSNEWFYLYQTRTRRLYTAAVGVLMARPPLVLYMQQVHTVHYIRAQRM